MGKPAVAEDLNTKTRPTLNLGHPQFPASSVKNLLVTFFEYWTIMGELGGLCIRADAL